MFNCLLKQAAKHLSKQCIEHFVFYRYDCLYFHVPIIASPFGMTVFITQLSPRHPQLQLMLSSFSSCMRVMNHNWSATKQRPHPQSVAEISQFCQGTGFDNVRHHLGLATRTQTSVCKSPFPSAGTEVSLFRAKTVQQRLMPTNKAY